MSNAQPYVAFPNQRRRDLIERKRLEGLRFRLGGRSEGGFHLHDGAGYAACGHLCLSSPEPEPNPTDARRALRAMLTLFSQF